MAKTPRFLHRDHLGLPKINCLSCHTQTRESPESNEFSLPPRTLCTGCHDGQKTKKLGMPDSSFSEHSSPTKLRFSHKQHLALGNVAPAILAAIESNQYLGRVNGLKTSLSTTNECQACHRGLLEIDGRNPAHFPQMADCLVCHATIEPPFSCELCHPSDAKLKPDTHTADFMDTHSSQMATLDRSTCKMCHGLKFRCKGCH
jgi:predicted CXXCH cytochrome family protein